MKTIATRIMLFCGVLAALALVRVPAYATGVITCFAAHSHPITGTTATKYTKLFNSTGDGDEATVIQTNQTGDGYYCDIPWPNTAADTNWAGKLILNSGTFSSKKLCYKALMCALRSGELQACSPLATSTQTKSFLSISTSVSDVTGMIYLTPAGTMTPVISDTTDTTCTTAAQGTGAGCAGAVVRIMVVRDDAMDGACNTSAQYIRAFEVSYTQ